MMLISLPCSSPLNFSEPFAACHEEVHFIELLLCCAVYPTVIDGTGVKGVDPGMEKFITKLEPVICWFKFSEFSFFRVFGVYCVTI